MASEIDAATLKTWLSDGAEIALLDVREHGQYGTGHLFFSVPLPYSRFEIGLPALVPNPAARIVLYDDGDGIAARAAARAAALGYGHVSILAGGAFSWRRAGFTLFAGVNVPSKTFGELVEHRRRTPRLSAKDLETMRKTGDKFVIVDGRPWSEYRKMNIPGGVCCPNGELALRIDDLVPDSRTKIVVNCAGRTRSIIGAQTLIDLGLPNPVYALENGTQGWFLAGLKLEHGAERRYGDDIRAVDFARRRSRARELARARGASFVSPRTVRDWLADPARTTYLFDIRTAEEFAESGVPGFVHAPGGQLIQATDQWLGVKGARIVLIDDELVRAPVVAHWLRQLGHEADVFEGGIGASAGFDWRREFAPPPVALPRRMAASEAVQRIARDGARVIDLRPGMAFRKSHILRAVWSIRPHIAAVADPKKPAILVADEPEVAGLAALDLAAAGVADIAMLAGGFTAWQDAGLPVASSPEAPSDAECIDYLFFVHDRHDGNAAAARQYLAWETGLLAQLDEQERGVFRVAGPA